MDIEGFRELLKTRALSPDRIEDALTLAERFESYIDAAGGIPDAVTTWAFCKVLIQEGQNTYANLVTIARYGLFIRNNDIYVAILELLDGAEAQPNLYQKVADTYGEPTRDSVFAGIGVASLGIPSTEKPRYMQPVIKRLVETIGRTEVETLLSACLRDLPDQDFQTDRIAYLNASDIQEYLRKKRESFLHQLRTCHSEGKLFFAQEITDEVLAYVAAHPEIACGVLEHNILYVSKIPYNTKAYLAESDPTLKRYYACHCPWAREAVKRGEEVAPVFCNCSAGFHKKPWEVIFSQPLHVDVLESILKGDSRCRFAIHLPEALLS